MSEMFIYVKSYDKPVKSKKFQNHTLLLLSLIITIIGIIVAIISILISLGVI